MTPEEVAELLEIKPTSKIAQHITLSQPYDGIYLIVPRASSVHKSKDSPVAQMGLLTSWGSHVQRGAARVTSP